MLNTKKSKTAIILTTLYLVLAVFAFAVMLMASQGESLAGIFVVLVAMPWTILLTWLLDNLGIDSIVFNTIFLALCCMLNAFIIYYTVSFLARRFRSKV